MIYMKEVIVIKGKYKGRKGKATMQNELGLVMFYPEEGIHPYRVCIKAEDIKILNED